MTYLITNINKNKLKNYLIKFHQKYAVKTRVEILSHKIIDVIKSSCDIKNELKVLDFGCGNMKIASCINQFLPKTIFTCSDIHEPLSEEKIAFDYVKYKGEQLAFVDDYFDVIILSDVLHHIPESQQNDVIAECVRLGKIVIIKDHFEKGILSRLILVLMDVFGNWASGIRIPMIYFTKERFLLFCDNNNLECDIKYSEIALYDHLPLIIRIVSPPYLQFIAVLKRKY